MTKNIFDIEVNLGKLDAVIENFEATRLMHPYLIMNEYTLNEIAKKFSLETDKTITTEKGKIALYHGYKVLIDNDISVGVVDIR